MKKIVNYLIIILFTMVIGNSDLLAYKTVPAKYKGYAVNITREDGNFIMEWFYDNYSKVTQEVDNIRKTAKLNCTGAGNEICKLDNVSAPEGTPNDIYNNLQDSAVAEINNGILQGVAYNNYIVQDAQGKIKIFFTTTWSGTNKKNCVINITTNSMYDE